MAVPKLAREIVERLKADPEGFLRVWRDVLAIFWFMGAELEPFLDGVAWDLWLKQHYARNGGANELTMRAIDVRLEHRLHDLVSAYRMVNRKWRDWLQSELGSAGRAGMWHLRLAVETRLKPYQELVRTGKLPKVSPLELAIDRWSPEIWDLDAPLTDFGDEDEGEDDEGQDEGEGHDDGYYDELIDENELIEPKRRFSNGLDHKNGPNSETFEGGELNFINQATPTTYSRLRQFLNNFSRNHSSS